MHAFTSTAITILVPKCIAIICGHRVHGSDITVRPNEYNHQYTNDEKITYMPYHIRCTQQSLLLDLLLTP